MSDSARRVPPPPSWLGVTQTTGPEGEVLLRFPAPLSRWPARLFAGAVLVLWVVRVWQVAHHHGDDLAGVFWLALMQAQGWLYGTKSSVLTLAPGRIDVRCGDVWRRDWRPDALVPWHRGWLPWRRWALVHCNGLRHDTFHSGTRHQVEELAHYIAGITGIPLAARTRAGSRDPWHVWGFTLAVSLLALLMALGSLKTSPASVCLGWALVAMVAAYSLACGVSSGRPGLAAWLTRGLVGLLTAIALGGTVGPLAAWMGSGTAQGLVVFLVATMGLVWGVRHLCRVSR